MAVKDYVAISRIDHWFKQVFVLPGVAVALYAVPSATQTFEVSRLLWALLATSITASSNYVINELIDAPFDRSHPDKRDRPAARGAVSTKGGVALWLVSGALGILLGWWVSPAVGGACLALWVMGLLYNIPPVRLKERPYTDVLSESVNNPIRFAVGWASTGATALPPVSIVAAYWMLGAFLMAVKRLAEYRHIGSPQQAAAYRRSFAHYTDERLLISIVYYVTAFGLCAGVFIVRYRIELLLAVPVLAAFMAKYLQLGFLPNSPTQHPEKLYRNAGFFAFMVAMAILCVALLFIDIAWLQDAFTPTVPLQ